MFSTPEYRILKKTRENSRTHTRLNSYHHLLTKGGPGKFSALAFLDVVFCSDAADINVQSLLFSKITNFANVFEKNLVQMIEFKS